MAKKKSPDLFGDDSAAKPMSDFEAMLNASQVHARGLAAGDRFRGEVLAVSGQEAFVSTGTPTDATMPLGSGEPPKVGDFVDVIVVRAREGEILVKGVDARGVSAEVDSLEDAYDMEIPIEGLVLDAVKGGFRVKVQGQNAFCPISQIDFHCTNAQDYVGRKYEFIITRMERGRDLVVSRRKLLEIERAANEGEFLNSAEEGSIHSATVFRLEKYGAFVRLENGIEGLIPISELSFSRIGHPQEAVNLDQVVQVKLLRAVEDGDRLKVSFSLKQGGSVMDPWATLEHTYPLGTQVEGVVERKEPFGLFVNISNGITGLLPRSAWREAIDGGQYENKRKGDKVKVRVDRIDNEARKLAFSLPRDDEDDSWRSHSAAGRPTGNSFGTLGDLLKNVQVKRK
ncbi:MAG: S1 RNA-binding domain-containing protein [Bdellovibrionales bacterium]|nr:S1 RNA-binding domain-containing protein [Bdellovibrionales bacterium]